MRHFTLISTILGLSAAVCSCTVISDTENLNSYQWGFSVFHNKFSGPVEDNMLYLEVRQGLDSLMNKYNGSGLFSSDAVALEKANCEAALNDYDKFEAAINKRIRTVDNNGMDFMIESKYYVARGETPLRDDVFKTFELKDDDYIRFNEYTTVSEVTLSDELLRGDPASYPVTVNLENCGMLFDDISDIRYDSVKVYDASTRVINTELNFISGGSTSLNDRTLTLTFTGTSATLDSMTGEWYANAYVNITGLGSASTGIVKVPFRVL